MPINKRAIISGALGATASSIGKLALSPESPVPSTFLDGMNESGSVVGTALSTAANFSFSALYGILFFEEHVPISWFFGATMIAIGMYLLSSVTLTNEDDDKTKTD
eukprot:scaffold5917_cov135-Skeletonema_menzelii.AAC.5